MIDVAAARRFLAEELPEDESVELQDVDVLDAAAAVIVGGRKGGQKGLAFESCLQSLDVGGSMSA